MNTDIPLVPEEKTKEDIAREYIERQTNAQDLLDFAPGWEEKVYFNSIEEAWPGFRVIDSEEKKGSSTKHKYLSMLSKSLNVLSQDRKNPWKASLCEDNEDDVFLMLESEVEGTGEKVIQKVGDIRYRYSNEEDFYKGLLFFWELESLIVVSKTGDEVVLLDHIFNPKDSNTEIFCNDLCGEIKKEERALNLLDNGYSLEMGSIRIMGPSLQKTGLATLFHELGHAYEARSLGEEVKPAIKEARKIIKNVSTGVKSEESGLSPKTASEIMIKQERIAWLVALKLLKLINEGSKKKTLEFGGLNHRKMVEKVAEWSLKSYDQILPKSENSLGFSQYRRAELHSNSKRESVSE